MHLGGDRRATVKDRALGRPDLLSVDLLALAHVLRRRRLESDQRVRADRAADAAQLKLGRCLERHNAKPIEEVHRDLADGLAADDDGDAGVGDRFDGLLHLCLLRLGIVHQLVRRLDEHSAFCLCRGRVDRAAVHRHLGTLGVCDRPERLAHEHHPLHDVRGTGYPARNLRHADIVHVEPLRILGHDGHDRLGNHWRDEVLEPILLGGDHRADRTRDLGRVVQIVDRVDGLILESRERHLRRLVVPRDDLRRVHALVEQLLRFEQQLAGEHNHEVGAVAHLLVLHLRGKDK
mmetsp:Transcript_23951/g.61708  ORF Transcript_23951/g.61708 Transcript_23951/m.61708 type:complete len:291 (-) Transcript_23951:509-1381(-)